MVDEISFESGNVVNFKFLKSNITENLHFKVGIKSPSGVEVEIKIFDCDI